jgi:hypothetical protein
MLDTRPQPVEKWEPASKRNRSRRTRTHKTHRMMLWHRPIHPTDEKQTAHGTPKVAGYGAGSSSAGKPRPEKPKVPTARSGYRNLHKRIRRSAYAFQLRLSL